MAADKGEVALAEVAKRKAYQTESEGLGEQTKVTFVGQVKTKFSILKPL